MNNIEILEEFIKHYKEVQEKYKDDEIQAEIERSCYFEEVPAEALENLIKENKKLDKENQGLFEAYNFNDTNLFAKTLKEYRKEILNSISKSKLKEIIYPTPENPIPFEVQTSEMYKRLEKLVEGE